MTLLTPLAGLLVAGTLTAVGFFSLAFFVFGFFVVLACFLSLWIVFIVMSWHPCRVYSSHPWDSPFGRAPKPSACEKSIQSISSKPVPGSTSHFLKGAKTDEKRLSPTNLPCGLPAAISKIISDGKVFRGAEQYMSTPDTPVNSDSADTIIDLAKSGSQPLYIAAMGCVTNIATALLRAPEIRENIVVIWTSAYPSSAPHCNRPSLNLIQDIHASRLMFDSGVPLVYLPGYHVGAQLKISLPEVERFIKGAGEIGDYLHHLYTHNPLHTMFALQDTPRRTWVIWDIIDIAWLINPDWVPTTLKTAPILDEKMYWKTDESRHLIREAHDIQRDEIFLNFYDKLANYSVL